MLASLAVVITLSASAAFVPPAAVVRRAAARNAASLPITMVTSREVFGQLYEASPPTQKSLQALPNTVAKGAMLGLVGVSAVAGYAVTPSIRIPVKAVGGALAAPLGIIARKRVSEERQKAAVPAVAALLAEGLGSVDATALAGIANEYNVPKKQFDTQLGELYLAYLNACLTSAEVAPSELSEILQLQTLLKLTAAQAGNQVYSAARQLFSRHRAYLEDDGDNDSKALLKKFVFLSERIVARDDSPEGYRYETLRLQKLFNLTPMDWQSMAEGAAVPFYEKALANSVLEGKPATPERLAGMRASLGVSEGCAEGLHAEVFAKAASAMLVSGTLTSEDQARVGEIKGLLSMPDELFTKTLSALTAPLYSATFSEAMADTSKGSALAGRQQELMLDASQAASVETAALRAKASSLVKDAAGHLRVQNVNDALSSLKGLVSFVSETDGFMASLGKPAASGLVAGLRGALKASEVTGLYKQLLLDYLGDMEIDSVEDASLKTLASVLGLSEAESSAAYVAAAGPLFKDQVTRSLNSGSLGAEAKSALDAAVAKLALPADVTSAIAIDCYNDKLVSFTSDSSAIMTEEQAAELQELRSFLGLEMSDLYEQHQAACSESYTSSVREVMGASGIIPDEYWDGLLKLRERLGLSEEASQELIAGEVTVKLKEFGTKCQEALEAKAEAQQKQQQAASGDESAKGDMNIKDTGITSEVNNLIEFAVASRTLATKTVDGQEVEVAGASLRGQMEDRTLKELYRQYVVEAFSGADPASQSKSMANLEKLSLVLGLQGNEVSLIHTEIGSLIYRQYISKALPKGPLGAEETSFLASIKESLGMEQSKCDELIREQQLNRVSVMIESIFGKSQVLAEDVRKMRDTADLYDIDLDDDLEVSELQRTRLFVVELEDFVSTGELSTSDTRALEELCEVFKISEEKAQSTLESIITKRIGAGVLNGAASLRQGDTKIAIEEVGSLLNFASLNPDTVADAPAVGEGERTELFMVYQTHLLTGSDMDDEKKERLELLKSVMGLSIEVAA